MDTLDFIMAVENGSITDQEFFDNVQAFVDSNVWRSLQGSWQQMVVFWESKGWCTL